MPKIAGYILNQHIDRGDDWLNAVDPMSTGPFAIHRQCAWEDDGLRMVGHGELEIVSTIALVDADKYVCSGCREKLSAPAYFSFEEAYKRLHAPIGWIQTVSHEEMYGPDHYRDVVDAIHIVCLDCERLCPYGSYEPLMRGDSLDNYKCSVCNKPMILQGKEPLKEAKNGACSLIQLFYMQEFAPCYFVAVVTLGEYKAVYELHTLPDADALYEALLKVSA